MSSAASKIEGRSNDGKLLFNFPPEVVSQNFMMLQVMEKTRSSKEGEAKETVGRIFILPIPSNLTVASKMEYEQKNIGALGALAAGRGETAGAGDDISSAVSAGFSSVMSGLSGITEGDSDNSDSQTLGVTAIAGVSALAGTALGKALKLNKLAVGGLAGAAVGGSLAEGVGLRAGLAINPHLAVLFKGVGLRNFGFQYKFVARNQQESNTIRDMIKALQYHMHPDYFVGNFAFQYPDEFKIEFSANRKDWLYNIKRCVLTDMTVNYNGESMPIFFDDIGAPVSIDISMSFQETKIHTKRDFAEDYEIRRGVPRPARPFGDDVVIQGGTNAFGTRG